MTQPRMEHAFCIYRVGREIRSLRGYFFGGAEITGPRPKNESLAQASLAGRVSLMWQLLNREDRYHRNISETLCPDRADPQVREPSDPE